MLVKLHAYSLSLPANFSHALGGSSANTIKSAPIVGEVFYRVGALSHFFEST